MIVRILTEGQLQVPDELVDELNVLDEAVSRALEAGDEGGFQAALHTLLTRVREVGQPLPDDSLESSSAVLPASDSTMTEVAEMLADDGLIPG